MTSYKIRVCECFFLKNSDKYVKVQVEKMTLKPIFKHYFFMYDEFVKARAQTFTSKERKIKMTDNLEKDTRNMLAIKHDIIKILIENETDNNITHEETENFIFFINAILNKNKSKNSIEGRIRGLQSVIKECYYEKFKKVNDIYTKTN